MIRAKKHSEIFLLAAIATIFLKKPIFFGSLEFKLSILFYSFFALSLLFFLISFLLIYLFFIQRNPNDD